MKDPERGITDGIRTGRGNRFGRVGVSLGEIVDYMLSTYLVLMRDGGKKKRNIETIGEGTKGRQGWRGREKEKDDERKWRRDR